MSIQRDTVAPARPCTLWKLLMAARIFLPPAKLL
jgi:hypothetical protein